MQNGLGGKFYYGCIVVWVVFVALLVSTSYLGGVWGELSGDYQLAFLTAGVLAIMGALMALGVGREPSQRSPAQVTQEGYRPPYQTSSRKAWVGRGGGAMSRQQNEGLEGQALEIRVRFAAPGDEDRLRRLLELNGMHRRLTGEKSFLIAEQGEEVLAALEYRLVGGSLLLGLSIAEPWSQERVLARVLYAEARILAREASLREVRADANSWDNYPYEVGYRRQGRVWQADPAEPLVLRDPLPAGGWRRVFALWGSLAVPFFRTFPR